MSIAVQCNHGLADTLKQAMPTKASHSLLYQENISTSKRQMPYGSLTTQINRKNDYLITVN